MRLTTPPPPLYSVDFPSSCTYNRFGWIRVGQGSVVQAAHPSPVLCRWPAALHFRIYFDSMCGDPAAIGRTATAGLVCASVVAPIRCRRRRCRRRRCRRRRADLPACHHQSLPSPEPAHPLQRPPFYRRVRVQDPSRAQEPGREPPGREPPRHPARRPSPLLLRWVTRPLARPPTHHRPPAPHHPP